MSKIQKTSLNDIPTLAKTTAKSLEGGEVFALIGELGAGKTTFVKAVGKHLGIKKKITSPTFVLLNSFAAKLKSGKKITFYHLDLYRSKNIREIKALGLVEFLGKKNTVSFIEWADKIKKHLPKKTQTIKFKN